MGLSFAPPAGREAARRQGRATPTRVDCGCTDVMVEINFETTAARVPPLDLNRLGELSGMEAGEGVSVRLGASVP